MFRLRSRTRSWLQEALFHCTRTLTHMQGCSKLKVFNSLYQNRLLRAVLKNRNIIFLAIHVLGGIDIVLKCN